MTIFTPTIGLEVHCQLKTQSKMFCACPVTQGAEPNTAVCGVCLGHPGALPVVNDAAVRLAVRAGLAVGCAVHDNNVFSRKHYFYPDSPKGYQISQFDRPICTDGAIHVERDGQRQRFEIERIHMEEDAGKLTHDGTRSLVDWNRGGTPLVEIVGRPDLHSAEEAEAFLRMLHRVMVEAGVTIGDMEKGHFRCDANVSVSADPETLGTRVELKNINSFRFVSRAIRHEIDRQIRLLESGESVVQSTRSWDGHDSELLRSKEHAADYRYFPDPDLGPVSITEADLTEAADALKGRPLDVWLLNTDAANLEGFQSRHGLNDADAVALLADRFLRRLFERTVECGGEPIEIANWVRGPIARWVNDHDEDRLRLEPDSFAALVGCVTKGTVTRDVARDLMDELCEKGGDPAAMIESRGLGKIEDEDALLAAVRALIAAHPDEVKRYCEGQTKLLGFFIGGIMRSFGGRMDPVAVRQAVQTGLQDVVSIGLSEDSN